jgi:hypothetical protein
MLSIGEPDNPAWLPAAELGDEAHLRTVLARVGDGLGVTRLDVLAQWMAEWLGWVVGQPQVALLAGARRVPIVGPDDAAILFIPSGHPAGLRVRTPRLVPVPGDDAAPSAPSGAGRPTAWLRPSASSQRPPALPPCLRPPARRWPHPDRSGVLPSTAWSSPTE